MNPLELGPGLACLVIFGLGGIVAIILISALESIGKPPKK